MMICFAVSPWSAEPTKIKALTGTIVISLILFFTLVSSETDLKQLRRSPLTLPILGFITAILMNLFFTISNYSYLSEAGRILPGLVFALFIPGIITQEIKSHVISLVAVFGSLTSLYGLIQKLGLDPISWSRPISEGVFSTFGHPNIFAAFLLAGIGCSLIKTLSSTSNSHKVFWISNLFLAIVVLVSTYSKGALLGLFSSLLFCGFVFGDKRIRIITSIALIFGVIVLGVLVVIESNSLDPLLETNQFRLITWRDSIRIFASLNFVQQTFGTGLGTYMQVFDEHRNPDFLKRFKYAENLQHAHSEFIEMLIELGWTGLSIFVLIFLIYLIYQINRQQKGQLGSSDLICTAIVISIMIHNSVCVNLRWFSSWTTLLFFMGISVQQISLLSDEQRHKKPGFFSSRVTIWMLFTAVCLFVTSMEFTSDLFYYQGLKTLKSPDSSTIEQLRTATKLNPWNKAALYDLAFAYSKTGHFEKAIELYELILRMHPNYQRSHRNAAINYRNLWYNTRNSAALNLALAHMNYELLVNNDEENILSMAILYETANDVKNASSYYQQYLIDVLEQLNQSLIQKSSFAKDGAIHSRVIPEGLKSAQSKIPDVLAKLKTMHDGVTYSDLIKNLTRRYSGNDEILSLLNLNHGG